jgi:hypothetical protein
MIDKASVFAERFKSNPQILQATVLGQGPDPSLDPYTALRALQLIKESNAMAMARQAQQPTSAPSLASQAVAPQGLAAMLPMGAPAGQMPQMAQAPQAPVMQASGGLASMPTPEEDYAAGGIVAFQVGGKTQTSDDDEMPTPAVSANPELAGLAGLPVFTSQGDPETYGKLAAMYPGAIEDLQKFESKGLTPKEYEQVQADEIAAYRKAMGPNTAMESLAADIAERKKERAGTLEEGKGVALLKAAAAVAQGNNWVRAFANAGAAFGDEYTRALQADKSEKRSIALAEFNMADAQRKENIGLFKEGRAAADRAMAARQAAEKARLDKTKAVADALAKGMSATKPLRSAFGAGAGGPKLPQVDRDAAAITKQIIALEAKDPNDPQIEVLKKQRKGLLEIIATGKEGPTVGSRAASTLTAKQNAIVVNKLAAWDESSEAYRAKKDGTYADKKAAKETELRRQAMEGVFGGGDDDETPSAAPAASPTAKPGTVLNYDASGKRIK